MMPEFLHTEYGFNLTIFALAIGFCLLAFMLRVARSGSDALTGIAVFLGIKLAEGFFLVVALLALIGVIDKTLGALIAAHATYAVIAALAGVITSIDALLDD